jgi:5-methylcytosine-specific restriction endonuclease McrA
MDPHKRCSSCLQDLPLAAFDRRRHYVRAGVRAACRTCTRAKAKQKREQQKEQQQAAPDRTRDAVRARTRAAIARGTLVPAPCAVCGDPDVEAHHPDYERVDAWAHVEWLCRLHHAARHGRRPWTRQLDWLAGS